MYPSAAQRQARKGRPCIPMRGEAHGREPLSAQSYALRSAIALPLARLRTVWRHVLAIDDWNKRDGNTSFPIARDGTTPRLGFQGAIVSDGGPNAAHGCCQQPPSRYTRHRTCDDGDCGAQHPVVLERYVAPKGMRHNPNAPPANNTLGAVYIRRAPRAFACTDNDSARKLTSTLWAHSLQLTGTRTDEFQNRLCLPNLVREALENSNRRRRRNDEPNSLAGEFEMMRNLFVTRGNPTLKRASG